MAGKKTPQALVDAREEFLARWGELGPAWGVNRTMSQVHALLMVSREPLNTDEIMAALDISRGNAHGNIKELRQWGVLRRVRLRGERKELEPALTTPGSSSWAMFTVSPVPSASAAASSLAA